MKRLLTYALAAVTASSAAFAAPDGSLSPRAQIALKAQSRSAGEIVSAYVTIDAEAFDQAAFLAAGAAINRRYGSIITARVPADALPCLAEIAGVERIEIGSPVEQMLDVARAEAGADAVHKGEELDHSYKGEGVVVGIVDFGFDYGHEAFYDNAGNLRISRVWEQNATPADAQSSPEGYGYGVELTTAGAIAAAGGDVRNNSHGTHVASIAAGSSSYLDGALEGIASAAQIVLVSMQDAGTANVCISDAISYIFQYADEIGAPCVVNLSLGAHAGAHDGTSTFDQLADAMQGPGRLIVGAAGNHRADAFHIRKDFQSDDLEPLRTIIDYKHALSESNAGGDIEIWASPEMQMEVALVAYKTTQLDASESVTIYPAESGEAASVSLGRNVSGDLVVASEISPLNGKHHIVISSKVKSIRTGYAVGIELTPKTPGSVDIWADNSYVGLTDKGLEGFTAPSDESTICEIGGTAKRILTVGAYTTRASYRVLGESSDRTLNETDGDLGSFSSCGPTADGRIKPQVTAPGCFISSAVSAHDASGTIILSQYNLDNDCKYGYMQGTSMSSPLMAGIVATWLQACPDLTPETLEEVVSCTSRADQFTGQISEGSNQWGYGKADALAGLKKCIELAQSGGVGNVEAASNAPAVSRRGNEVIVTFAADAPWAEITVCTPAGAIIGHQRIANAAAGQQIALPLPYSISLLNIATPAVTTTHKLLP